MQDQVSQSKKSLKKSNSRSDFYDEPLETTYDRLQSPEKLSAAKKDGVENSARKQLRFDEEGDEEKQGKQPPMKHRFVDLIIQQLRFDKDIESVKETLFCFENFNLVDSFKKFDNRGRGFVTPENLEGLAEEMNVQAIVDYLDSDQDGKLSYTEWTRALTPKNLAYAAVTGKRATNLDKEEQEARENSWFGELKNLLHIYSRAAQFNKDLIEACRIDGDNIFD